MIPLCLFLFVCEIPTDENTFLINVVLIAPCVFREEQSSMLTPLLLLFLFWYNKPPIHGIVTPYPWYFEHLPMVYHSTYPWYIEPSTHDILIPYPWYIEPSTNGILSPLPWIHPQIHGIWHLPMVYRTPTNGILIPLSMVFCPILEYPYPWYFNPHTNGMLNPLPPIHGILTPTMVYRTPTIVLHLFWPPNLSWYFDPTSLVFWPPTNGFWPLSILYEPPTQGVLTHLTIYFDPLPCYIESRIHDIMNPYQWYIEQRWFLPSWFCWGVSEDKMKMWKFKERRSTDAKWWKKLTLPLARRAKKYSSRLVEK